jgi:hypothetical protein
LGASAVYKQIGTVDANVTSFTDVSMAPNRTHYYRVRSYVGTGFNTMYTPEVAAVATSRIIRMHTGRVTTCDATFMDSGGMGAYGQLENHVLTVAPAIPGQMVQVTFTALVLFNGGINNEYLLGVYDGANTQAP